MRVILAYMLVNFIPGLGIYFLVHKRYRWSDLIGFSFVYSICFTPILIYIFRLINMGNSLLIAMSNLLFLIAVIVRKRGKLKIQNSDRDILRWSIILTFFFSMVLLIVYFGYLSGTTYQSNIIDLTKHYGALVSVAESKNFYIDNPFATGNRMYYYFFFYFRSAEVLRISGIAEIYQGPTIILFIDSIVIFFSTIYLLFKIGKIFNAGIKNCIFILMLLLLDGGFDSLYLLFKYDNEIVGGYIDGWPRVLFQDVPVSVVSHSNFLTKLIWQPQHVSAMIPFLLFVFVMFYMVKTNQCSYKGFIMIAMCTVSILGYSALIAVPTFFIISYIMLVMLLSKRMKGVHIIPFIIAFVMALPIISTYFGHNGSSSALYFRTLPQYYEMVLRHPCDTLIRVFVEYGIISIVFVTFTLMLFIKKEVKRHHCVILGAIFLNIMLALIFEMEGTNDIGMAISFSLYILLFVYAVTIDLKWIFRKTGTLLIVMVLLIPCVLTNAMSIFSINTMNVSLKHRNSNIMQLSDYIREQTNYGDSVIIFSHDVRDLNNYVPMLMHTKTYYPFFQGPQYLRGKELEDVTEYALTYASMSIEERAKTYELVGIDYFIVLPNSQESAYFSNRIPVYSNAEFIVYKAEGE